MKKMKVIVAGTTFGQFYMEALKRRPDLFEFVGILANGSKRSLTCAEIYQVPLYHTLDEIPQDVDIACIVIRSGALGGNGTDLALQCMERNIHVIQEQPIHYKDLAVCLKAAVKHKVYFKVGDLYVHLPEIKRFIAAANAVQKEQKIIYANLSCCPQVSYPMMDILEHILPTLKPLEFQSIYNESSPFHTGMGIIGKIPVVMNYNNEIDPDDPDNYMQLLHSAVLGFDGGHLQLSDTFGPVTWVSRLHIPVEGYKTGIIRQNPPEHMQYTISKILGDYREYAYTDMVRDLFPNAVAADLTELYTQITTNADMHRLGQKLLLTASQWHKMTKAFGFAALNYHSVHKPISPTVAADAAAKITYSDFFGTPLNKGE